MKFKEVLNKYLKELNCSSKKLSDESGLSESVISRYRSGERTPLKNSEQLNKLTKALFNIAKDSGKNKYTFDKIIKYKNNEFKYMNSILKKNKVFDYIYIIKENDFISDTPSFSLNNLFIDKIINYTYKEYIEHLKLTNLYFKNFCKTKPLKN